MKVVGKITDLIFQIAIGNFRIKLLLTPVVALLYLSLIAAFIFISFITDHILNFPKVIPSPWSLLTGIPLITAGFVLMILIIIYFAKSKGTPVLLNPPPTLITTGPYKYARNPMLTGIFIQLFGLGILCHSFSLIFIFTPLFILLNIWELKNIEEPELEKRIGKAYMNTRKTYQCFSIFKITEHLEKQQQFG